MCSYLFAPAIDHEVVYNDMKTHLYNVNTDITLTGLIMLVVITSRI